MFLRGESLVLTTAVVQLLVLDPEKRLSLEEVQTHPWIIKHCVKGERAANREKLSTGSSK